MTKFLLGEGVRCDVDALIDTRVLIQANSGGGKSWCLRRLLEQTHGRVQHLVIDPEGEFASLRERFDYVLAARHGGDTAADPRAAKLLAERLLELGVSAILDIYELKAHERIRFVRLFLEALVDAPKKLWHPALVVVDEAHIYCPQQGEAESAGPVIDLATRGRKRGFCAVLATQRLAKLHKDAAAELNNKLIGRTGLDVDVKRAADELGFGKDRWRDLRELEAGAFYAFGPALSREVRAVTIGPVQTTHPKAGARLAFTAPPPTAKVKALLPKLADLPAEAEERQKSLQDLQRELAETKRALSAAQRAAPAAAGKPEDREKLRELAGEVSRLRKALEAAMKFIVTVSTHNFDVAGVDKAELERAVQAAVDRAVKLVDERLQERTRSLTRLRSQAEQLAAALEKLKTDRTVEIAVDVTRNEPFTVAAPMSPRMPAIRPADGPVTQRILNALAELEQLGAKQPVREMVAFLAGYSHVQSKGFVNALGALRSGGCLDYPGDGLVALTDEGRGRAEPPPRPKKPEEVQARIISLLGGASSRILAPLIEAYPTALTREALAGKAGYGHVQSKGFVNAMGRLRTLGFVTYPAQGTIAAAPVLFLEGR